MPSSEQGHQLLNKVPTGSMWKNCLAFLILIAIVISVAYYLAAIIGAGMGKPWADNTAWTGTLLLMFAGGLTSILYLADNKVRFLSMAKKNP